MLFLRYLLLFTGWGLLAAAAINVFKNLYHVVQYHRQLRHIAPGSVSGPSSGPEGAPRNCHQPVALPWKNRN